MALPVGPSSIGGESAAGWMSRRCRWNGGGPWCVPMDRVRTSGVLPVAGARTCGVVAPGEIGCPGGAVALPFVRQGSVARVQPVGCPDVAGGTVAGRGAFRWIGRGRRKCCRLPGRGHAALSLLWRSDVRAVRWRCRLAVTDRGRECSWFDVLMFYVERWRWCLC